MRRTFILILVLFSLSVGTLAQGIEDYLNQLQSGADASDLSQAKKDQLQAQLDSLANLITDPETPPSVWWKALDVWICLFRYAESYEKGTPPEQTAIDAEPFQDIKLQGAAKVVEGYSNPFPIVRRTETPDPPSGNCSVDMGRLGSAGEKWMSVGIVFTQPTKVLTLFAEGKPAGGTFSWALDPEPSEFTPYNLVVTPDGKALFESGIQGLGAFRITVTYTAPDGTTQCEAFADVNVAR
ncbi:MAG: hypothetical protein P8020_18130 [Acidobacteriota bacterium]